MNGKKNRRGQSKREIATGNIQPNTLGKQKRRRIRGGSGREVNKICARVDEILGGDPKKKGQEAEGATPCPPRKEDNKEGEEGEIKTVPENGTLEC